MSAVVSEDMQDLRARRSSPSLIHNIESEVIQTLCGGDRMPRRVAGPQASHSQGVEGPHRI